MMWQQKIILNKIDYIKIYNTSIMNYLNILVIVVAKESMTEGKNFFPNVQNF